MSNFDVLLVLLVIILAALPREFIMDLEDRLRAVFDGRTDKTLFITTARTLRYGDVVGVIDAAKAPVQRVGIITDGRQRVAGLQ